MSCVYICKTPCRIKIHSISHIIVVISGSGTDTGHEERTDAKLIHTVLCCQGHIIYFANGALCCSLRALGEIQVWDALL